MDNLIKMLVKWLISHRLTEEHAFEVCVILCIILFSLAVIWGHK